jgi:hypothetical protein
LTLIAFSIASMAWFALVSRDLAGSPTTGSFHGSIDVVVQGGRIRDPDIRSNLTIRHWLGKSGTADLQIDYVACGEKAATTIDGMFVFAGDARLSNPNLDITPELQQPASMTATILAMGGQASGPVEVYPFRLELIPCAPDELGKGLVPLGSAISLRGRTQRPVTERNGIRHWFAPPVVGGLPGVPEGGAGVFSFDGKPGKYFRSVERANTVQLELPGFYTTELTRPDPDADLSDGFTTVWTSKRAAVPVGTRLLNEDRESELQYRLVAASIGIGIGGNIIASLLWGWVSPKLKNEACVYPHAVQPSLGSSTETATAARVEGPALTGDISRGKRQTTQPGELWNEWLGQRKR